MPKSVPKKDLEDLKHRFLPRGSPVPFCEREGYYHSERHGDHGLHQWRYHLGLRKVSGGEGRQQAIAGVRWFGPTDCRESAYQSRRDRSQSGRAWRARSEVPNDNLLATSGSTIFF